METSKKREMQTIILIPESFTMNNEDFNDRLVKFGENVNQIHQYGEPATQTCKYYLLSLDNNYIRLIHTRVVGDTRRLEQDKKNMENILSSTKNLGEIHGICVFSTLNISRLSMFRFCIKRLCHLHKSASQNIVFVSTMANGTFYRPGDPSTSLKAMLQKVNGIPPNVDITFNKETSFYCESFAFLMALKEGIKFEEEKWKNFSASFGKSIGECGKLIKHIAALKPHNADDPILINKSRKWIVVLSRILSDINQRIQLNVAETSEREEDFEHSEKRIRKLSRTLHIMNYQIIKLNHPQAVCTSSSCISLRQANGQCRTDYKTICHDRCYCASTDINDQTLRNCAAMENGKCRNCGCVWDAHVNLYYRQEPSIKEDKEVEGIIDSEEREKEAIELHIEVLEMRRVDLENERATVTKIIAMFVLFLRINTTIVPPRITLRTSPKKGGPRTSRVAITGCGRVPYLRVAEMSRPAEGLQDEPGA